MITDKNSEQDILNRWNDRANTLRPFLYKTPVQNTSFSAGTTIQVTGTSGTTLGSVNIAIESGYCYVLKSLNFAVGQSGTFGTNAIVDVRIDNVNIGQTGTVNDFLDVFGAYMPSVGSVTLNYQIKTGTGVVGTYTNTMSFVGYKFRTIQ